MSSDFAHDLRLGSKRSRWARRAADLPGLTVPSTYKAPSAYDALRLDIDDFEGNPTKRRSFASARVMGQKLAQLGLKPSPTAPLRWSRTPS